MYRYLIQKTGLFLFIASIEGCNVDVKQFDPPVALPDQFSKSGIETAPDQWWQSFNDPKLNRLIEAALINNQDLRATFNRLEQAQAVARKAGSELIPAVNGNSVTNRTVNDSSGANRITTDIFSVGIAASYELDLWGRIRANTRAAELDSQTAMLDIQTAAIALSAQIARSWYQLIEQQLQLKLLNQQLVTNQQNVDLVMARFQGGQATAADLFQQQQVLEAVRGEKYTVLATIEVLKNQLAVLTGIAPGTLKLQNSYQFPDITEIPNTGLTAGLIQRRPDIQRAYFRIQAADLRVAAAVADRFPKLSLSASIDTSAPNLQDFFNNWMATLAGNLVIPIIDGNRRIAEVDRNKAATAEAYNLFGQNILQAVQEVENALTQEHQQHQKLTSLEKQLRYLTNANNQIRLRYGYGAIDFLRVLSSIISLQSLERSLIRAQFELIEFRINLYRALAGGWELEVPESHRSPNHG